MCPHFTLLLLVFGSLVVLWFLSLFLTGFSCSFAGSACIFWFSKFLFAGASRRMIAPTTTTPFNLYNNMNFRNPTPLVSIFYYNYYYLFLIIFIFIFTPQVNMYRFFCTTFYLHLIIN